MIINEIKPLIVYLRISGQLFIRLSEAYSFITVLGRMMDNKQQAVLLTLDTWLLAHNQEVSLLKKQTNLKIFAVIYQ